MKNQQSGISVIEVIIAIGLLGVMVVSVGQVMAGNNRLNNESDLKSRALLYAQESVEIIADIKNEAFGCICAGGVCPTNECTRISDGKTCPVHSGYGSCWTEFADGLGTNGPLKIINRSFVAGSETVPADTTFEREILIRNLQRDSDWEIVDTGGTVDWGSKEVAVIVSWNENGTTKDVTLKTLLTAWQNF